MISTIEMSPGVSKNPKDQIKYPSGELERSNLFKFEKPSENWGFFDIFVSRLTDLYLPAYLIFIYQITYIMLR